jgi:hypothetical protein
MAQGQVRLYGARTVLERRDRAARGHLHDGDGALGAAHRQAAVRRRDGGADREALTSGFLAEGSPGREGKLVALVAYLLSIDEDAEPIAIPALGPGGGDFCKVP